MASEQFSQAVRGSSAEPVSVGQTGSIETNDYDYGDAFEFDGSAYPYLVDPAETIHELTVTESADVYARITTNGGNTFDLPLKGGTGTFDRWNIDSVEFVDPNGTGASVAGGWAGE